MTVGVHDVARDLVAEQDSLDEALAGIAEERWSSPTASPRWTIADQIAHLAYFDGTAALAITDPDGFKAHVGDVVQHFSDELAVDEVTLGAFRKMTPGELVSAWRDNRARLAEAATHLDDDTRVVWYGPSMGAKSFLTARLMECWAHGQDAVDAAGVDRRPTDRLQHIARLGVITRGWSYANRGLDAPESEVYVELDAPSGDTWSFGETTAAQSIRGAAEDFCLVVTQRRHVDSTDLDIVGNDARDWMLKAQVFAGPPTDGPAQS